MRIAGEIVNYGSAASDLTQSRATRSATRRPGHKIGRLLLLFIPGTPIVCICGQARACQKSCPKNWDVPKSSFLPIGSRGAHRQAQFQISTLVRTAGAVGTRI